MLFIFGMKCMDLQACPTIKTWLCLSHTRLKSNDEKAQDWRRKGSSWEAQGLRLAENWLPTPTTEKLESATKPLWFPTHFSPLLRPPTPAWPLSLEVFVCLFLIKPIYHPPAYPYPFWTLSEVIENKRWFWMINLVLLKTLNEIGN